MTGRVAVVLFNLGGPDSLQAVRPFLRNLFSDPNILQMPGLLRWFVARIIAVKRAPSARRNYGRIGGRSPILPQTEAQAAALDMALSAEAETYKVFVSMRYWYPQAGDTAREVADWKPDRVVLLPLYPQFSSSTTGSFLAAWRRESPRVGLEKPTVAVCCWPELDGFVEDVASATTIAILKVPPEKRCRVLFSAHGLPRKFVDDGDPYQDQVERSVRAVVDRIGIPELDFVVCYQSRVGPLEWLQPYTEDEIRRAGDEERALVVVPISFVSEHVETLVELDMDYAELAASCGVDPYLRVETVRDNPVFVEGLKTLVRKSADGGIFPGGKRCGRRWGQCPCGN